MTKTKNKKILITGGCGYLGSQLLHDLAADTRLKGYQFRILDNMQDNNYRALMGLPSGGRYHFIEGDILDPAAVRFALQDIETVIHLAAVVQTPLSFQNPNWAEQVNHWGTARLVESCLESGVENFIHLSTSAVYGPGGPFSEEDTCRPFGAYAQSKYRAETKILPARERGLKPIILRLGTIFGLAPVVRFDAVANRFAYLTGTGRNLTVFGQGTQLRPFIHVRDASQAILFCLTSADVKENPIYNVCSDSYSVLDLVEAVQQVSPEVEVYYTEQDVLTHLSIEVSNIRFQNLGWRPEITLVEGLGELIRSFDGFTRYQ